MIVEDGSGKSTSTVERSNSSVNQAFQHHLAQFLRRNTGVCVPNFASQTQPNEYEQCVLSEIEKFMRNEEELRRNKGDDNFIQRSKRGVIILVSHGKRADDIFRLVDTSKELRATIADDNLNIGKKRSKLQKLDTMFNFSDIVIAKADTVQQLLHSGALWWRRVAALIIIDAQKAISVGSLFSIIIRESYRTFHESERPQILAIASCKPTETNLAALESNLLVRFPGQESTVEWRSEPNDRTERRDPSVLFVEVFEYPPEPGARRNSRNADDYVPDIDVLMAELGPCAVVHHQHCLKLRGLVSSGHQTLHSYDASPRFANGFKVFSLENRDNLTGISFKALMLLEILQRAHRASTKTEKLKVLIFAGAPIVAVVLNELISAIPGLRGLKSRLYLSGSGAEKKIENADGDLSWQGSDTDEDASDEFGAGDANILVAASSNIRHLTKRLRPLPPCGLVIRFDGSCADPATDGGGGPCRVLIFKSKEDRRSGRSNSRKRGRKSRDAPILDVVERVDESPGNGVDDLFKKNAETLKPQIKKQRIEGPKEVPDLLNSAALNDPECKTRLMRVAKALQGPIGKTPETCFLYLIRLPDEKKEKNPFRRRPLNIRHREEFAVLLTYKLTSDDLVVNIGELGLQIRTDDNADHFKLELVGPVRLTIDELCLARQYIAKMFSNVMRSAQNPVSMSEFIWDTTDLQGCDEFPYRRNYLVVPLVSKRDKDNNAIEMFIMGEGDLTAPETLKKCINFAKMKYIVEMKSHEKSRYNPPRAGEALDNHTAHLEGNLFYVVGGSPRAQLAGSERPDKCPLSLTNRSKTFDLNLDGSIKFDKDIKNLINAVEVEDEDGIAKKSNYFPPNPTAYRSRSQKSPNVASAHAGPDDGNIEEIDLHGVSQKVRKHRSKITKDSDPQIFDPKRNRVKKRTSWVGSIHITHADKFLDILGIETKALDQSMLVYGKPPYFPIESFIKVLKGIPATTVAQDTISKVRESYYEVPTIVPEMCRLHPITVSSLFIPSCLFLLERHVLLCELREQITRNNPVPLQLGLLSLAVSSTLVHEVNNYERLEFLGDSVLKLSTTNRLFTDYPHEKEGFMHDARKDIVSNENLRKKAMVGSLVNYLCFSKQFMRNWRPPGTDRKGRTVALNEKSLADVMEALCGAIYLSAAQSGFRHTCEDSKSVMSNIEVDNINDDVNRQYCPLIPDRILLGYEAGAKFLQDFGVYSKAEPTREQTLLSAIHALHEKGSPAPTSISPSVFPRDSRMSRWSEYGAPVEKIIRYKFKRRHLLMCALTHGSYVSKGNLDSRTMGESCERLEFLGDAVVDFFAVLYLFENNKSADPGKLTELKGKVVSNETFARVSLKLGLDKYLIHRSPSLHVLINKFKEVVDLDNPHIAEEEMTKHAAPKALGDLFEAIIGAIFVDSGLSTVMRVCMELLKETIDYKTHPANRKLHPQSVLLHYVQTELGISTGALVKAPYMKVSKSGDGEYKCIAYFVGVAIGVGKSSNKKRAQLLAARSAYERLKNALPGSDDYKLKLRLQMRANEMQIASR